MPVKNVHAYSEKYFPDPFFPKPYMINALFVQSRGGRAATACQKCTKEQGNFCWCIKVPGNLIHLIACAAN